MQIATISIPQVANSSSNSNEYENSIEYRLERFLKKELSRLLIQNRLFRLNNNQYYGNTALKEIRPLKDEQLNTISARIKTSNLISELKGFTH